jgi:hypothetical protein
VFYGRTLRPEVLRSRLTLLAVKQNISYIFLVIYDNSISHVWSKQTVFGSGHIYASTMKFSSRCASQLDVASAGLPMEGEAIYLLPS